MAMKIVAAPWRQLKTYTVILGIFIGSVDALLLALSHLADVHWLTAEQLLATNAILGFLIVPAKLIVQMIPATTSEKIELALAVAEQPVVPGHADIAVIVQPVAAESVPAPPPSASVAP